jgi:amidohydrolase
MSTSERCNQIEGLASLVPRLAAWRRDVHAHPELAFDENRTAGLVAEQLRRCGIEGTLRCGSSSRAYAFRADMDALPIEETNTFGHRSRHAGRMHACGHDGHTAMLLGAAEYLAHTRSFSGTLYFIFQPAEETCAGADAMLKAGLLVDRPVEAVFAMHNAPGLDVGKFNIWPGSVMAAASTFDIRITGVGCHAAMPHQGVDSILVGSQLVVALQSVVSRNVNPMDTAVLTVTQIRAGHAYNVSPDSIEIAGCVRSFSADVDKTIESRLRELTERTAAAFGAKAEINYRRITPPLLNSPEPTRAAIELAVVLVGADNVDQTPRPSLGTDDFAFFSQRVPVSYALIGNGAGDGGCTLHNSRYDFNDEVLPLGVTFWAKLAERLMPLHIDISPSEHS